MHLGTLLLFQLFTFDLLCQPLSLTLTRLFFLDYFFKVCSLNKISTYYDSKDYTELKTFLFTGITLKKVTLYSHQKHTDCTRLPALQG